MLSLVPTTDPKPIAESPRKMFWRTYLAWLANAGHEELAQLEHALAPHAHEVRPLVDAVRDALQFDPKSLPQPLLAQLQACGWCGAVAELGRTKAA